MTASTHTPEGEITPLSESPLQAGNIDDLRTYAVHDDVEAAVDADERAVLHLLGELKRKPNLRGRSDEDLRDAAETFYAQMCQQLSGPQGASLLNKYASLLGEQPAALRERLTV